MHVLLVALQDEAGRGEPGEPGGRGTHPALLARAEAEQALALASALGADGRFPPLLVCLRGSWLHEQAQARGLSVHAVRGPRDMVGHLRLWRWQRRHEALLVQTVGAAAAPLGRRVLIMRKKGSATLAHAFFVRAPWPELARGKAFRAASRVFCGSEEVRGRIRELWDGLPEKKRPAATLELLAPGIPLADYAAAKPWPGEGRYIFGMGESLAADSGALIMVRAMAALWQREDLPLWEVRMFGSGPRFEEVLREAERLGVAAKLCILGDQSPAEAVGQCAVWVAPGSSPEELPQTLWAGVAAEIPVICAQSPLHRERLAGTPAATAVRVREQDPQALARAMIAIMREERLRARMREAEALVRPHIGLEATAARYVSLCADMALGRAENPRQGAHPRSNGLARDETPQERRIPLHETTE